jgi:hypothetical protein
MRSTYTHFWGRHRIFRGLIKDYAKVKKVLDNLVKLVELPAGAKKQVFRTVRNFKLSPVWTEEPWRCFINLKHVMIFDPVLQAPRFEMVA